MRDRYVEDALRRVAEDAAERLAALLAEGEEIPYEVAEQPGEISPLYRYAPKTDQFIRAHVDAIAELDSFVAARSAIAATSLAAPYLEEAGLHVPAEPDERAGLLILLFLCRLWDDSVALTVDEQRFDAEVSELWASADDDQAIEVIVPIVGLHMAEPRLELSEALLVRAEGVDVPDEAKRSEGMDREAWEPQFLAVARVGDGDGGRTGGLGFRRLITTLRLFKAGGVGLGPHAWARSGERWRRISTGAGRPRAGGWHLAEDEVAELVAFSRALEARPRRSGDLAWAISRFEMGCERQNLLEALSDYVLALRAVLEGGGPAEVGLSMRLAALCAEPADRMALKNAMDRALNLERSLMGGAPSDDVEAEGEAPVGRRGGEAPVPLEVAQQVEEHLRAILRDAACGHLGTDLRATADEILLADGLSAGEGAAELRGATSEWRAGEELDAEEPEGDEEPAPAEAEAAEEPEEIFRVWRPGPFDAAQESDGGKGEEPEPEAAPDVQQPTQTEMTQMDTEAANRARIDHDDAEDWLEEVEELAEHTLEWPAFGQPRRREERDGAPERDDADERVSDLFPAPETTEWSVGELEYNRSKHDLKR